MTSSGCNGGGDVRAVMEAGVIQDNGLPRGKVGNKNLLKPGSEDVAITVPFEGQGRDHVPTPQSSDHTDPLPATTGLEREKALPFGAPAPGVVGVILNASLVQVDQTRRGTCAEVAEEALPSGFVPLLIAVGLFLRVKPIFFNPRLIVIRPTPRTRAIASSV